MKMDKGKALEFQINLYVSVFTVSSFIGWLYETILTSVRWGYLADRGFLNLPICPIYGFGALFLLLILGRLENWFAIFMLGTIATTAVELAASYVLEYCFHLELWTYRHWPLHFQGRISFWSSVLFGVLGVLLLKVVYPVLHKLLFKVKAGIRVALSLTVICIIVWDTLVCIRDI